LIFYHLSVYCTVYWTLDLKTWNFVPKEYETKAEEARQLLVQLHEKVPSDMKSNVPISALETKVQDKYSKLYGSTSTTTTAS